MSWGKLYKEKSEDQLHSKLGHVKRPRLSSLRWTQAQAEPASPGRKPRSDPDTCKNVYDEDIASGQCQSYSRQTSLGKNLKLWSKCIIKLKVQMCACGKRTLLLISPVLSPLPGCTWRVPALHTQVITALAVTDTSMGSNHLGTDS